MWVLKFFGAVMAACVVLGAGPALATETPFERPSSATKELTGLRTAASRTWELRSGKHLTQVSAEREHWRSPDGSWQPFDLDLDPSSDGWIGRAGLMRFEFPARLDAKKPVKVFGEKEQVGVAFIGESERAEVTGPSAVYREAARGVDVKLQVVPGGLKEDLILQGPDAERQLAYRLTTESSDVDVRSDRHGGLNLVRDGVTIFRIPAPVTFDADGAVSMSDRVSAVRLGDKDWRLEMHLDNEWLDAPSRAWPVSVDPSVLDPNEFTSPASLDCLQWVTEAYQPSTPANPSLIPSVGCGGTDPARAAGLHSGYLTVAYWAAPLWRFGPLTLVAEEAIESASLKFRRLSSSAYQPSPIGVYRVTNPWTSTGTGPAMNLGQGSQPLGAGWFDPIPAHEIPSGPAQGFEVDLTTWVDQWQRYTQTGGVEGLPNHGIVLKYLNGSPLNRCTFKWGQPPPPACEQTVFGSGANSDPSARPVLEVESWPTAPSGSAVLSPGEGDLTGRRVRLQAQALRSSVSSVRFQYIAGSQRTWADIPLAALRSSTRAPLSSTDIPVQGPSGDRRSDMAVWDLSAMPGGDVDGAVHVRAYLDSTVSGDGGMTKHVNFRLDRRGIDGVATVPVGPGEVNLLSGEFSMTEQDVSIPSFLQDLSLSRTYRSRGVSKRNADMFGPQWEASIDADGGELPYKGVYNYTKVKEDVVQRGYLDPSSWNWELFFETFEFEDLEIEVETFEEIQRWEYRYAVVESSDGTKLTFTQTVDPSGQVTGWEPDDLHPGYKFEHAATATPDVDEITLTEPSGAVAKFTSEKAKSPNYRLRSFKQPGSPSAMSYEYANAANRQWLTRVTAPKPTGGIGRSLELVWSVVPTPGITGGPASVARVTAVKFSDGVSAATTIAQYAYDNKGRLIQVTDPRVAGGLPVQYEYDSDNRLGKITPAGEEDWRLTYTTEHPGDAGPRLETTTRDHPTDGSATTTIRYGVPLSGPDAPYDLSPTETARWGQIDDLPWDAVAIFPEGEEASETDPDYEPATIYYVGLQGKLVNVAEPGGHIATAEHDAHGNVIRALTAGNRARALAAGATSATVAQSLSTRHTYAANGVDRLSTMEPTTSIKLSNGTVVDGRRISSTQYDDGAPSGGPYHLPTSELRAVELAPGNRVEQKQILKYEYDALLGGMSGWVARQPTKTTLDPNGLALQSWNILHPTYPLVEEARSPEGAAGGNSPDVQYHQYYGITPVRVPSGIRDSSCTTSTAARPTGFVCMSSEGTTPTASIPRRWFDYHPLGMPLKVWQGKSLTREGTGFRRITMSYDNASRETQRLVEGGTGTAVPATTYTYDAATGEQIGVASTGRGSIQRTFDSNGRLQQYVDSTGTTTTYDYDLRGRIAETVEDGERHKTYEYDDRNNVLAINDPTLPDPVEATYGPDGELLTEELPIGLRASFTYDPAGRPSELRWDKVSNCSSNCLWAQSKITSRDADANITGHQSTTDTATYGYDGAQRLSQANDTKLATNRCTRRQYTYDPDSNRLSRDTQVSIPAGACGSGTTTTRTWTQDTADRMTTAGWTHDAFGRATAVPAADAGGTGALNATYNADDIIRQMTLDGRTHTYGHDPLDRIKTTSSTGGATPNITSTEHYTDDEDMAVAVTRSDGSTERFVIGPGGELIASEEDDEVTYQLRDLQGSVVALADDDPNSTQPTRQTSYDEFGRVTSDQPNVLSWAVGQGGNGWLGGHQRSTEFQQTLDSGGPVQMGVRTYLPAVGRFLQPDPIEGGAANRYDYALQNPLNHKDLDGEFVPLVIGGIAVGVSVGRIAFVLTSGVVFTTAITYVAAKHGELMTAGNILAWDGFRAAKGGKKNVKSREWEHMNIPQLEAALKNPKTPKAQKQKIRTELKGRNARNKQKRSK